ncbi:transcription elongation factor GreB [Gammaproteobacteria bacterium]|nr:transcription elongation factor GreB [Gammaproteobacteria bacterium]
MSRYRAPQKPSSNYVTAEGRQRLRDEVYQLWKVERPVVTQAVSDAAAQGDRSENADYIYGKRRLREIDSRVRYLSKRLENFIVVDRPPEDPTRVFFAAFVSVEFENSVGALTQARYRIVGADELDPSLGYISVDSPLARELIGKRVDDEVSVSTPTGVIDYAIVDIEYAQG